MIWSTSRTVTVLSSALMLTIVRSWYSLLIWVKKCCMIIWLWSGSTRLWSTRLFHMRWETHLTQLWYRIIISLIICQVWKHCAQNWNRFYQNKKWKSSLKFCKIFSIVLKFPILLANCCTLMLKIFWPYLNLNKESFIKIFSQLISIKLFMISSKSWSTPPIRKKLKSKLSLRDLLSKIVIRKIN